MEYLITPRVDQRFSSDDNLQLNADRGAIEAYMYELTVGAQMRARGDTWGFSGDAMLQGSRFDDDAFDSDNQRGNFSIQRFGEKSLLQMDMGITRQAQRTAELDGSGLLGVEATRVERFTARPVAQFQLSERYQLTVGGSFTNEHYETLAFNDFENLGVDIAIARQMTERTVIDFTLFGSEFETEVRDNDLCNFSFRFINGQLFPVQLCSFFGRGRETTTVGAQIGFRHSLSESFEWRASFGGRDVETRDVVSDILVDCVFTADFATLLTPCTSLGSSTASDNSSGVIASTNLSYRGKRLTYNLGFERSVSPISLGFLIESDRINANARYKLRETMTAVTNLGYQTSESTTEAIEFERQFVSVDVGLDWRVSENWRVVPGVRWREQETTFFNFPADSISFFVDLNYRPNQIQFSR